MHSLEGFNPIPEGYVNGRTKYLIITGSVISGVGKGIITASISRLLEDAGLRVLPFKFDGYLNNNAGTLNPYRHGEVFVLDDGTECDMDLGTYERFMNTNLTKRSYLTNGELMSMVLRKEAQGDYLGRDVQYYPHVAGEIKHSIRKRAMGHDVMLIEVGGTIGDDENALFIGAMRELMQEEGHDNVTVINIPYILEPPSLGEQKSKPAQLGIKELMRQGLRPDLIIARSHKPVTKSIREKLSLVANLSLDRVYGMPDLETVYQAPLMLREQGLMNHLPVNSLENKILEGWSEFTGKVLRPEHEVRVMVAGKYTKVSDSYASIQEALVHAGAGNDARVKIELVETTELTYNEVKSELSNYDGLIIPGGFGTRGVEGKINAVRAARETKKPFLGLCYGMQLAVIEYARNVCGLRAHTTEVDEEAVDPVVFLLPEQHHVTYKSGTMRLGAYETRLSRETRAYQLYGHELIKERFRHRYEVNPEYVSVLESEGLVFSGESSDGLVKQVVELPGHPFFIGTQFHPELTSKPLRPNPLFNGFVRECLRVSPALNP